MIKNLLIDLDDTILDFHKAESVAMSETFRIMGVDPTVEVMRLYSGINKEYWKRLERGECVREEVLVYRFRDLYKLIGSDADPAATRLLYEEKLSECAYFLPGGEELLKELFQKYRLYLCTNGTACVQEGRIKRSGIAKYFAGIFISQNIGYDKPKKEYFDRCFALMGDVKKEETVIIGDSLTSDIAGGINAGIRTLLFAPGGYDPCEAIKPDFVASALCEIPGILERI